MRFPLLPGRSRTADSAGRSSSGPRKNIPFFGYVLPWETTCASSVAYMWNRPAISRAIVPTLPFFPRISKNVYCSGTTIKLTILHKDPSVKGFSCVFSRFCTSFRQIFLSLSSHGLSLENRTDIWRCLPSSDFPEKAFSGKFGRCGQASRRQAPEIRHPSGKPGSVLTENVEYGKISSTFFCWEALL